MAFEQMTLELTHKFWHSLVTMDSSLLLLLKNINIKMDKNRHQKFAHKLRV